MGSIATKKQERALVQQINTAWNDLNVATSSSKDDGAENLTNTEALPEDPVGAIKYPTWTTVRIFVSSTFKDFHAEREVLAAEVFPELETFCRRRGLQLVVSDLRLNIPRNITANDLLLCSLRELARCKQEACDPLFLALIGNRPGYMPKSSELSANLTTGYQILPGMSAVETEIINAAYLSGNPNALFLLREPRFLRQVPVQYQHNFVDTNSHAAIRTTILRDKVKSRFPPQQVYAYSCDFDGLDEDNQIVKFRRLDGLKKCVFDFFKQRISAAYPKVTFPIANKDKLAHWSYLQKHFVGSSDESSALFEHTARQVLDLLSQQLNGPIMLTGSPGCGKTSALKQIASVLQKEEVQSRYASDDTGIFIHFANAYPEANLTSNFLCRLQAFFRMERNEDPYWRSYAQLTHLICAELAKTSVKPCMLLIDGFDHLETHWIPKTTYPHVKCVLTAAYDTPLYVYIKSRCAETVTEVHPRIFLSSDHRIALNSTIKPLADSISESTLQRFEGSVNPSLEILWGVCYASQLAHLRDLDFKRETTESLEEFTTTWLNLCEESLGFPEHFVAAVCFLSCSPDGLTELEMKRLLKGISKEKLPRNLRDFMKGTKELRGGSLGPVNNVHITDRRNSNISISSRRNNTTGRENRRRSSIRLAETEEIKPVTSRSFNMLPSFQWLMVREHLEPLICYILSKNCNRFTINRWVKKLIDDRYYLAGGEDPIQNIFFHQKLAELFADSPGDSRRYRSYIYHLHGSGDFEKVVARLSDQRCFDALYDDDHSEFVIEMLSQIPNGFQRFFEMNIREEPVVVEFVNTDGAMFQPEDDALMEVMSSDGDRIPDQTRRSMIGGLFTQAWQYELATKVFNRLLTEEERHVESDNGASFNFHKMIGLLQDLQLRSEQVVYKRQQGGVENAIFHLQKALQIAAQQEPDVISKKELTFLTNRMAFYQYRLSMMHSAGLESGDTKSKGYELAERAGQLGEESALWEDVAMGKINQSLCLIPGTIEQVALLNSAKKIVLEKIGWLHPLLIEIPGYIAGYHEELGDYETAYAYWCGRFQSAFDLYGWTHDVTRRAMQTLEEPLYNRFQITNQTLRSQIQAVKTALRH